MTKIFFNDGTELSFAVDEIQTLGELVMVSESEQITSESGIIGQEKVILHLFPVSRIEEIEIVIG